MRKIPKDCFIGAHYIGKEEEDEAVKIIRSKSLFRYDGENLLYATSKFEKSLKNFFNSENVLACSSGAAALKLSCIALDIGVGDEVLMSPFTFIASGASVLTCGALPNFVDIDETMNIDIKLIEERITERTKAIMAIHIQGVPCDMKPLMDIAKKHNLYVIEDAAQAFGASYGDKLIGTFGDAAAMSLQGNKIITCGEGGIFTCKEREKFIRAMRYHDNGGKRVTEDSYPVWDEEECSFGENFKITELQSAIANEQLKKVDIIISKQRQLYINLIQGLNKSKYKIRPIVENANPVPVSLCLIFENSSICNKFIEKANEKYIPFELYCDKLLTSFNTFKNSKSWSKSGFPYNALDYKLYDCKVAEDLINRTAWMPISPLLNKEDIEYIQDNINKIEKEL